MQALKYDAQGHYTVEDIPFHEDGMELHPPETPPVPSPPPDSDHDPKYATFSDEIDAYAYCRFSPRARHRSRALSRPEAQLLTPDIVRLREEKRKKSKLRRYSIHVIVRDGVREPGSEQFQKALRQDSIHELHPGWQSLRRMTGVIG